MIRASVYSPVTQLADYYKDILMKSCPRPDHVIKNSIDFKDKIKNVIVPSHHCMVSLDIVSMYPSIPFELVKKSIEKRWKEIKRHTCLTKELFLKR